MQSKTAVKILSFCLAFWCGQSLLAQNNSLSYLAKANYATQRLALDSLVYNIGENPDEKSIEAFNNFKNWAANQKNQELISNIILHEFRIKIRSNNNRLDSINEIKLLEFLNSKNTDKLNYIRTDALFILACSYFNKKKYALSMRYHYSAHEAYSKYTADEFPFLEDYYYEYGRIYYFFKDFKKAASIYKQAWNAIPYNKFRGGKATRMNTLALCFKNMSQFDSAIYYFSKAQKMAIESNEEVWEGILSGNVADIYATQKRYDEAIPLLMKNIEISKKYVK